MKENARGNVVILKKNALGNVVIWGLEWCGGRALGASAPFQSKGWLSKMTHGLQCTGIREIYDKLELTRVLITLCVAGPRT